MAVCGSWRERARWRLTSFLLGLVVCLGCVQTTPDHNFTTACDEARQCIERRAFDEAAAIFDAFLATNQNHARAVYKRAGVYELQGRREEAIQGYAAALRIDAELHAAAGADSASRTLQEGAAGNERALAHCRRGRLLSEAGRLPEALAAFTAALQIDDGRFDPDAGRDAAFLAQKTRKLTIDGGCVDAYVGRGAAFLTQKMPDLAIDDLTQALRLQSDHADALCRRALALLMKNEPGQAAEDCRAAIRAAPNRADAYATLGAAYIAMSPPRFNDAEVCVEEAVRRAPAAAAAIEAEAAQRWLDRAVALHAEGSRDDAEAARKRAVAIDPGRQAAFIARLADLAQAAAAPSMTTLLKPVLPDDRALKLREDGRRLLAAKQCAEAERVFTEAIQADPRDAGAYCGRGQANLERGFPDTALADFDEALRLDARNALAYCCRARAQVALNDYSHAVSSATCALRIEPRMAAAYQQRAEAYAADRNFERAVADMKEAIAIDAKLAAAGRPFLSKAYVNWGLSAADHRQAVTALRAFGEAVGLNPALRDSLRPQIVAALRMHAKEQAKGGEWDAALQSLETALREDDADAESYRARGGVYFQQGQWEAAITDLERALDLDARLSGLVRIDLAEAQRRRNQALPAGKSTQDSP